MRKRKGWALKVDSYSKMIVWFLDGNIRTFYSLDWKSSHSPTKDRTVGIERLRRKMTDYAPKSRKIKIYDLASDRLIAHYEENEMIITLH